MTSDEERCAEHERFKKIDAAFMAVAERNAAAVDILLEAGADPRLRTRIDECETPREMAEAAGLREIADRLAAREARLGP
jgi:hypothetical protein